MKRVTINKNIFFVEIINQDNKAQNYRTEVNQKSIQFHFCIKGQVDLIFNPNYKYNLQYNKCLILYNPNKEIPFNINTDVKCTLLSIFISITEFHNLLSEEKDQILFLKEENTNSKYYHEKEITVPIMGIINNILNSHKQTQLHKLYLNAKILELLSQYFNSNDNASDCLFLMDEKDRLKIKEAKDILLKNIKSPPTIKEISNKLGINLNKLKTGFKEIYGKPMYTYLLYQKMELGKKLLSSKKYNVNEVSVKLGYSTATHFINAFKKIYNITPKKYLSHILSQDQ